MNNRFILLSLFFTTACGSNQYDKVLAQFSDPRQLLVYSGSSFQQLPQISTASDLASIFDQIDSPVDADDLQALPLQSTANTKRFQQLHHSVPVEGADVAMIYRDDRLVAINSGLVDAKSFPHVPTLSAGMALTKMESFALAVKNQQPQLLLALTSSGHRELVWRFTLVDGGEADIGAAGSKRGMLIQQRDGKMPIASTRIYNAELVPVVPTQEMKGILVLDNGSRTREARFLPKLITSDVRAAQDNIVKVLEFYQDRLGRNSYDNNGRTVQVLAEVQKHNLLDIAGLKENAVWMESDDLLIFGAGAGELNGFPQALDVVGHEFTHAVVSYSSRLVYAKESGALNEHLADVFGEAIQQAYHADAPKFALGENLGRGPYHGKPLRHMLHPYEGIVAQPGHVSETPERFNANCQPDGSNDHCGVHIMSGIPNRFAASLMETWGNEKATLLLYKVMTDRLIALSDFKGYANQLLGECMLQNSAEDCREVARTLDLVGILPK